MVVRSCTVCGVGLSRGDDWPHCLFPLCEVYEEAHCTRRRFRLLVFDSPPRQDTIPFHFFFMWSRHVTASMVVDSSLTAIHAQHATLYSRARFRRGTHSALTRQKCRHKATTSRRNGCAVVLLSTSRRQGEERAPVLPVHSATPAPVRQQTRRLRRTISLVVPLQRVLRKHSADVVHVGRCAVKPRLWRRLALVCSRADDEQRHTSGG